MSTSKKVLSDSAIKNAEIKTKQYKLYDSGGLYLLIKPNGGKHWKWDYKHGKRRTLSLGVYPKVTLKAARAAKAEAENLLAQHIDPSAHKRQQKLKAEQSTETTFSAIAGEWFKKQSNVLAANTHKRNTAILNNDILPYIGKRPIADLETYELVGCLARITDRGAPGIAHKARNIINQVCRYAKQTGRLKHNPASDLAGVLPTTYKTHLPAIIEPKLFAKLLVDIDSYKGTHLVRTALALAPLLFQRPSELVAMEWSELDLAAATWTIPLEKKKERNKAEGDHIVPLSKQALELLLDIQPLTGHGRYVFPNQRDHNKHMTTDTVNKALRKLGYDTKKDHCGHGFRASARTMMVEQLDIRIEWVEQQLAHSVKDPLGRAYNRAKHLPERTVMMQRWSDYLDSLKQQHLSGNVITGNFGQL